MTETIPEKGFERPGKNPARCICPRCGYTAERVPAVPCWSMTCPRCETQLTGEEPG